MTTRLAVVDDTDPRIQYSNSNWTFEIHGDEENDILFGPSVNHTSHNLMNTAGGSFSFVFNGTYVQPLGIIDTTNGKEPPTWSCFVDGNSIPVHPANDTNFYHTNADLCDASDLTPGEHVLTVNVTAPTSGSYSFGLDWIAYTPLQLAPIDETQILYVPNVDSNITTSAGWDSGGIASSTGAVGAQMVFTFTGTGVQGIGYSPQDPLSNPKGATYTIDNASPVSFDIPASATTQLYNVILFDVRNLSLQTHTLTVTFVGDSTKEPLEIDHFFVFNPPRNVSTIVNPTSSTSESTSATGVGSGSSQTAVTTDSSSPPTGAIVGGVVGGIVFLIIIAAIAFLFYKRRRRFTDPSEGSEKPVDPRTPTPFVFTFPGIQESPPSPALTSSSIYTQCMPETPIAMTGSRTRSRRFDSGSSVTRFSGSIRDPGFAGVGSGDRTALAQLWRDGNKGPVEGRAVDSGLRGRESMLLPPMYTEV